MFSHEEGHIAAATLPLRHLHLTKCAELALLSFLVTGSLNGLVGLRQSAEVLAGNSGDACSCRYRADHEVGLAFVTSLRCK